MGVMAVFNRELWTKKKSFTYREIEARRTRIPLIVLPCPMYFPYFSHVLFVSTAWNPHLKQVPLGHTRSWESSSENRPRSWHPSWSVTWLPALRRGSSGRIIIERSSIVPSGNLLHSYWKWPIYSRFSHWKWWFSIAMLVYQRVSI